MRVVGAAVLAMLALAGCDRRAGQVREESCVNFFSDAFARVPPDPARRVNLRYGFDVTIADSRARIDVEGHGIDGARPNVFAATGDNAAAAVDAEKQRLMRADSKPRTTLLIGGGQTRLVHVPVRTFSHAEARQHLANMCALSERGLRLQDFRVESEGSSAMQISRS